LFDGQFGESQLAANVMPMKRKKGRGEYRMAKIPLSYKVWQYQWGIDRLEQAFTSSIAQIEVEQDQASANYTAYIKSGEDDSEYEYDGEDRFLIKSTEFELQHDLFEIGQSTKVIREAFIVAAYHYWEKFARNFTEEWTFPKLKKSYPYQTHEKLATLNKLSNNFKHIINYKRMKEVHRNWREIFSVAPHEIEVNGRIRYHWMLDVRNDHVLEVFQIVRASGPVETGPL